MPRKPILTAALATGIAISPADAWSGADAIGESLDGEIEFIYAPSEEEIDLFLPPDALEFSGLDVSEDAGADDELDLDIYLAQTIYGGGSSRIGNDINIGGSATGRPLQRKKAGGGITLDNGLKKGPKVGIERPRPDKRKLRSRKKRR